MLTWNLQLLAGAVSLTGDRSSIVCCYYSIVIIIILLFYLLFYMAEAPPYTKDTTEFLK